MKKENSTNAINQRVLQKFCNTHKVMSQITGRWKVSIIFCINNDYKSYSDLKTEIPNLTDRVLTKQLKELQFDLIVENEKDKTKSVYNLSSKGLKILSLLEYINTQDFE